MLWGSSAVWTRKRLHHFLAPFLPGWISLLALGAHSLSFPATTTTTTSNLVQMNTDYGLPLETMALSANAYGASSGLLVERKQADGTSHLECAPMSLLPNAFPAAAFEQAQGLAHAFNVLVDKVSRDGDFLVRTLGGAVSEADPYTAKLLQLYQQVYLGPGADPFAARADRLGIFRSDYMLNGGQLKQIELNTISASFGALSSRVACTHQYLVGRFQKDPHLQAFLERNVDIVSAAGDGTRLAPAERRVPANPSMEKLPLGMQVACQRYKERFAVADAIVLFVVQEGETNTMDQRMLEFQLYRNFQIEAERLSLTRIHTEVELNRQTGALTYQGREIAVVYYRAGYAPTDYPDGYDGVEWKARLKLETSRAAKCPNLGYHLAGTKKVQQELARPLFLEKYFSEDHMQGWVNKMRQAFAGLYSLGDDATPEDLAAVRDALTGGHGRYVLKPQREGGGYNFYGEKLATKLRQHVTMTDDTLVLGRELGEYILMERLFPPEQKCILLRAGRVEGSGDSVSELGCYGTLVASPEGDVVHNEYAGFLLRTKFSNVDEGGVAAGFATLSSPYLC